MLIRNRYPHDSQHKEIKITLQEAIQLNKLLSELIYDLTRGNPSPVQSQMETGSTYEYSLYEYEAQTKKLDLIVGMSEENEKEKN